MLSRLVVLLLLAQGARADDCECTPLSQPPPAYNASQWPQFYIQNAIDNSGKPCSPKGPCVYTMDSGDPNKGIGNFKILNWAQDNNTNSITILGNNSAGIFNVPTAVTGMTFNNKKNTPFESLSQKVQVVVTIGAEPVNILCTLERTALGTTPAPLGTTPAPTAPPTGTDSISNDVIFMVDAGFNNGNSFNLTLFNEAKALGAKIVSNFTNVYSGNATNAPATGSRLGMSILSQIASGSVIQPWLESASTVAGLLTAITPVNAPTKYADSIGTLLNDPSPFKINNSKGYEDQNSRPQAQRMLIVVSSTVPTDLNNLVSLDFKPLDVHPVFIAYKFNKNNQGTINQLADAGWTVYNAPDNNEGTVDDFVTKTLLNANSVCPFDTTSVAVSDDFVFNYPNNYQGASSNSTGWKNNGQTARYCNFYKNVRKTLTATKVQCYTVFYDLEVEKDYLRFFDSSNQEIASFTGSDISGSTFSVYGDVTLQFDTNESQVFGGFQIEATDCPKN